MPTRRVVAVAAGLITIAALVVISRHATTTGQRHSEATASLGAVVPPRLLHPHLLTSVRTIRPGQVIWVAATGCAPLTDQHDEMTWHNQEQLSHPHSDRYIAVFDVHRTGDIVTAEFRVPNRTPPGKGLVDVFCGSGSDGEATALIAVA